MRTIATALVACGFAGAIAAGTTVPAAAQGIYFEGPGVEFGIGRPAYRERYYRGHNDYDYSGPRVYSGRSYYSPPEVYERRSYRRYRDRDWD
jgi:hypothetical protein